MSDSRFKVGDRVKYVQRKDSMRPAGLIGTVTRLDRRGDPYVKPDDADYREFLGCTSEFELVSRPITFIAGESLYGSETVALEDMPDVLNPDDPFERVLMDMVATNRRKRADYAVDGSPWSNFDDTANALGIDGFTPVDSVNFNIEQKSARLRSLRKNGRMTDPRNESVTDTYLDRAVYAVIALAMHTYPTGKVETTGKDAA